MNEMSLSMQNKVTKLFFLAKFSCKVCVGSFGPVMTTTGLRSLKKQEKPKIIKHEKFHHFPVSCDLYL